jgi:hypothetical protein
MLLKRLKGSVNTTNTFINQKEKKNENRQAKIVDNILRQEKIQGKMKLEKN